MNKIDIYNRIELAMENSPYSGKPFVMGYGSEKPTIMMVGEAPGASEEKEGKPFVGQAGKMLTTFLEGIGLDREDIYISNVVKIRPSKINPDTGRLNNRPPTKDEVAFFLPFLFEEIEFTKPKVIVTLGNFALCAVSGDKKAKIGEFHGEPLTAHGNLIFPMYHPASIIYNRNLAEVYNEDLGKLKKFLSSN